MSASESVSAGGERVTEGSRAVAWRADRWAWTWAGVLAVSLTATLVAQAPVRVVVPLVLLFAWFVAPGWLMVRALAGRAAGGVAWAGAPPIGYLLSSLALLGLWALGFQGLGGVALAPLGAATVAWGLGWLVRGRLRLPVWSRVDTRALLFVLALVPLIVGWPYARVGAAVGGGEAYRAYFTADFVWAMSAVAEVAKGAVPPVNPFRAGSPMHYYWLAHLFPAAEHQHFGDVLPLRHLLLVHATLVGLMFVAFLYGLARQFTSRAWAAAAGVVVAVFATSFEGLEQFVRLWSWGQPLGLVRYMNIDAVTRWVYGGLPIDGLQRLLLYQPQHQLGYATGFAALLVALRAHRAGDWRVAGLCGTLLGGSALLSSFSALMLTVVVAVYLGIRMLQERAWRSVTPMLAAASVPLLAAAVLTRALAYVELGTAPIIFGVNPMAVKAVLPTLGLGLGPFLILLPVAVLVLWRSPESRRSQLPLVMSVVGVCALFYVFVDVRDHQDVYVGWRVGHVLFILMAGLAALVFGRIAALRRVPRLAAAALAGLVLLAALPTPLIDLYNTQDITNFAEAPGFRWTLLLTPDEVAALEWVRTRTDVDAIVQVDPVARGAATWAYIPAFAERRMAAGLPISMIPLIGYERASNRVVSVFAAASGLEAAIECRRYGIDYLVVGPPERERHPHLEAVLDASPELFERVFESGTVSIYQFREARHRLAGRRGRG